jgi:TusA-related sulfurtransferase
VTTADRTIDAPGVACIDLTPLIATTMRELTPGQLLEVRTDDPAARVGVPAWCRLTRNPLLRVIEDRSRPTTTVFHITKKES